MTFYAHKLEQPGEEIVWQRAYDHCEGTARRAARCLKPVGLEHTAYLAGLLHDMGKYTEAFQQYLNAGESAKRGSVIHTFQGCRYLMENFHGKDGEFPSVVCSELIAFAIGAHHGLFDCVDSTGRLGLQYRAEKQDIAYEAAAEAFLEEVPAEKIEELFSKATEETGKIVNRLIELYPDDWEYAFETGLLARLLLSSVIEGDRSDTGAFMGGMRPPAWPENMAPIWKERLDYLEERLKEFPNHTPVEQARHRISEQCRAFGAREPGIFRLNVPTGGGKTLSSLRYALAHAMHFNKRRLIFATPLLSILEQNAGVLHDFIGDDRLILEHHSNVVRTGGSQEELDRRELLVESWDAPIVITTLVQLLNTMFDGKTTAIRRFQALCHSVIVIDEVQTVPAKLLTLFNLTIQFLSEQCGATVVLCSATQPELEGADHPLRKRPEEIVPREEALWAAFRRTELLRIPNRRLEELPDFIRERMEETNSLLVVCNLKSEAAFLLERTGSPDWQSFHLSASMCMQHRRDVLAALQSALLRHERVLCIATQVIEAGVDISFDAVVRLTAGMDSIVQAAGRCNRSGKSEGLCPVYTVYCPEENLGMLRDIQRGKDASLALMEAFRTAPERFDGDLFSEASIRYYYQALYRSMEQREQDDCIPQQRTSLFDLMGINEEYADKRCDNVEGYFLRQALKTAGQYFSVFHEDTMDVLVPYGRGKELIEELCSRRCSFDPSYRASVLKEASDYTVGIYPDQSKRLEKAHGLISAWDQGLWILAEGFYDPSLGILAEGRNQTFMEV